MLFRRRRVGARGARDRPGISTITIAMLKAIHQKTISRKMTYAMTPSPYHGAASGSVLNCSLAMNTELQRASSFQRRSVDTDSRPGKKPSVSGVERIMASLRAEHSGVFKDATAVRFGSVLKEPALASAAP